MGSGNLTPRGLRDNCEVFAGIEGTSDELVDLNMRLTAFLDLHSQYITEINEHALKRASRNRPTDSVSVVEPPQSAVRSGSSVRGHRSMHVLVAELPKGGSRWQQANFDYRTAREFFLLDPDHIDRQTDLFLTEVLSDRFSDREEVRRFTYTRSHNLRIQLAAKSGFGYPTGGRPIVVVRELKPRHFAYHLLFPNESGYQRCSELLGGGQPGKIRRAVVPLAAFRRKWPKSLLSTFD